MLAAQPPWAGVAFSITGFGSVTVVLLHFRLLGHVKCHQTANRKRREAGTTTSGLTTAERAAACSTSRAVEKGWDVSARTCFGWLLLEVGRSFPRV